MPKLDLRRPTVLALMGFPGAGKSTLARWLVARSKKLRIVSRDTIRAAMFAPCLYSTAEEGAAFEATVSAIRVVLDRGDSAIADGMCFFEVGPLEELRAVAAESGAALRAIYCSISVKVAVARVEEDRRLGRHPVTHRDATLVRRIAADFRALPDDVIKVDMEGGVEDAGRALIDSLKRRM